MKRKVLALLLATTMVLGSASTVLAAQGTGENTTGETITGTGDVSYVDTTIYSVTIPTTAAIDLVVDPQGLSGLEGTATAEELAEYAGKITCATKPLITNLSSVPAKVSVKLTLTGDATGVTTVAAVDDDTTKAENVLLYAVPSAVDTEGNAENYVASAKGIVLSSTDATVNFVLPAAAYNYVEGATENDPATYELVDGETGHGTALAFEGYVNKHADWSAYAGDSASKSIGMTAVFTFTHTLDESDVAGEGAYGMMDYAGTTVDVTPAAPADVAPSMTDVTYNGTGELVIPYSLGSGESGAEELTDIVFAFNGTRFSKNGTWDSNTNQAANITIADGTITLGATLAEFISDGVEDGTEYIFYLIFDGDTENYVEGTVTISAS